MHDGNDGDAAAAPDRHENPANNPLEVIGVRMNGFQVNRAQN